MSEKLVLHLTSMHSRKYGALEHYILEVARLCRDKGYRTVLQYESMPASEEYRAQLEEIDVEILIRPISGKSPWAVKNVVKMIKNLRPQVVQTQFVSKPVLLVASCVSKSTGVAKFVHTAACNQHIAGTSLKGRCFNLCDHVLAVSNAVAEDLVRGGVKAEIVATLYRGLANNPVRSAEEGRRLRREFAIPEEAVVLACSAFDAPFKGLDVLLDSVSEITAAYPDLHLINIGVNPERSRLPDYANNLGLGNRVRWAGIRDEGWQVLQAADIYVQPSRSEGFGLSILEAMALELPVVATRTGGIPEAVAEGETGLLANAGDVSSLVQTLCEMLSKRSSWKTMGRAGYQRYRQIFSGHRSAQTLVEKYYCLT